MGRKHEIIVTVFIGFQDSNCFDVVVDNFLVVCIE